MIIFGKRRAKAGKAREQGWLCYGDLKEDEEVEILYPRMVRGRIILKEKSNYPPYRHKEKEGIYFYDKAGKLKKKIEVFVRGDYEHPKSPYNHSYAEMLCHNKYIALQRWGYRSPIVYDDSCQEMLLEEIYTLDGNLYKRFEGGDIEICDISENGYMIGRGWKAKIYDRNNRLLTEIERTKDNITICEDFGGDLTVDGRHWVIIFPEGLGTRIHLVREDGKQLWSIYIDYAWGYWFWGDGDSNFVEGAEGAGVVLISPPYKGSEDIRDFRVCFIDWNTGKLKWVATFPDIGFGESDVKFSKDKKKIFVLNRWCYLLCLDVETGEVLWRYYLGEGASIPGTHKGGYGFELFKVTDKRIYIRVGYRWYKKDGWYRKKKEIFLVFDHSGRELYRMRYAGIFGIQVINKDIILLKDKDTGEVILIKEQNK